jgi:hypothetical protein
MFSSGPALMEIKRLKDRLETLKKEVFNNNNYNDYNCNCKNKNDWDNRSNNVEPKV